jgi:hypothetical protein
MLAQFVKGFTYNFQAKTPQQLISKPKFELLPEDERVSQEEMLVRGIELFMNRWGRDGRMNF